jgi:hypothetical protein
VEAFCREAASLAATVQARNPRSNVRFERIGAPLFLGTRGIFTKRSLSQQEYKFWMDDAAQFEPIAKFLGQLRDRMS